jgi:hypothetical protein
MNNRNRNRKPNTKRKGKYNNKKSGNKTNKHHKGGFSGVRKPIDTRQNIIPLQAKSPFTPTTPQQSGYFSTFFSSSPKETDKRLFTIAKRTEEEGQKVGKTATKFTKAAVGSSVLIGATGVGIPLSAIILSVILISSQLVNVYTSNCELRVTMLVILESALGYNKLIKAITDISDMYGDRLPLDGTILNTIIEKLTDLLNTLVKLVPRDIFDLLQPLNLNVRAIQKRNQERAISINPMKRMYKRLMRSDEIKASLMQELNTISIIFQQLYTNFAIRKDLLNDIEPDLILDSSTKEVVNQIITELTPIKEYVRMPSTTVIYKLQEEARHAIDNAPILIKDAAADSTIETQSVVGTNTILIDTKHDIPTNVAVNTSPSIPNAKSTLPAIEQMQPMVGPKPNTTSYINPNPTTNPMPKPIQEEPPSSYWFF